jgi:hypothetical protein
MFGKKTVVPQFTLSKKSTIIDSIKEEWIVCTMQVDSLITNIYRKYVKENG